MQLWTILGVITLFGALIDWCTPKSEICGLEKLHFPVVFRDDEGYCHFMEDGSQFLKVFEIQDLTDDQFQGWDFRGRSFRFVSQGYTQVFAVIGGPEMDTARGYINSFFAQASDSPGRLSPELQEQLKRWLDSLPTG